MADYRSRVAGLLFDEGGLSNSPLDITAARNPVPDGTGNHTNKGVTWAAFSMLAPKLGYKATPELFYRMPKEVWLKIYKVGFWDAIKGDQIKSQAVADMLVDMAFHAGPGRAGQLAQRALNRLGYKPVFPENVSFPDSLVKALNDRSKTKSQQVTLLNKIVEMRMAHLKSLSVWETFKNGWTARIDRLYKSGLEAIKKDAGKGAGLLVFAVAFSGWMLYQKTQS